MFTSEQKDIIEAFNRGFADKKQSKIIVYGIGINTKAVLEGTDGFSFIGLMDVATEGQCKYGYNVYSADIVAETLADSIIAIIARDSVINIIYKRIEWLHTEKGMDIYDYAGRKLGINEGMYRNESLPYWSKNVDFMKKEIDRHSIITFDIFDTLVTRKVLSPTDIFELVDKWVKEEIGDIDYKNLRLTCEKKLGEMGGFPSLDDIYAAMRGGTNKRKHNNLTVEDMEVIKQYEYNLDMNSIVPRDCMVDLFNYARKNKKVYLLSDMYYSENQIVQMLQSNGITGYEGIWISCERGATKEAGTMYEKFVSHLKCVGLISSCKEKELKKIVHIGDNRYCDYDRAVEAGIDAINIYNGYELLQASSMQDILVEPKDISCKLVLGLINASAFNNPFSLSLDKGWYAIHDTYSLGYVFLGPIILGFSQWFKKKVESIGVHQILFPSRDGYLIQKVYDMIDDGNNLPTIYFRASRRALTVASIQDRSDIERISSRRYEGIVADYMMTRFGIHIIDTDLRATKLIGDMSQCEIDTLLNDYEDAIISNAQRERYYYLNYLKKMGIDIGRKMAVFDFVASGTVQYNLERLLQMDLNGIYFATMNLPNDMYTEKTDRIKTAFGNVRPYSSSTNMAKNYLFIESILVDDKPTFSHIDDNGNEIYEEQVNRTSYSDIESVQKGILSFVADYVDLYGNIPINLKFADSIYGILFSKQCKVDNEIKRKFINDDYYDGKNENNMLCI